MSPMLHLFWHFYWANRVDFKFPGLHWSTVNGDRWLLRLSRKATPMLCFAHGGSEECEQQNREQGTRCPKCSNGWALTGTGSARSKLACVGTGRCPVERLVGRRKPAGQMLDEVGAHPLPGRRSRLGNARWQGRAAYLARRCSKLSRR